MDCRIDDYPLSDGGINNETLPDTPVLNNDNGPEKTDNKDNDCNGSEEMDDNIVLEEKENESADNNGPGENAKKVDDDNGQKDLNKDDKSVELVKDTISSPRYIDDTVVSRYDRENIINHLKRIKGQQPTEDEIDIQMLIEQIQYRFKMQFNNWIIRQPTKSFLITAKIEEMDQWIPRSVSQPPKDDPYTVKYVDKNMSDCSSSSDDTGPLPKPANDEKKSSSASTVADSASSVMNKKDQPATKNEDKQQHQNDQETGYFDSREIKERNKQNRLQMTFVFEELCEEFV